MTLQQLTYAVTVAECGTISAAAEKLFISQPSLTTVSYTHLDVYKRQVLYYEKENRSSPQKGGSRENLQKAAFEFAVPRSAAAPIRVQTGS